MTVASAKWKVTLPNVTIIGGALCDNNLQMKVKDYCDKDF